MNKRGTNWHPGTEIPPLHKWKWTDDDGIEHRSKKSDWMIVQDDLCDPEYTGPVVIARYEQESDIFYGWITTDGRRPTVLRWHRIPRVPAGAIGCGKEEQA